MSKFPLIAVVDDDQSVVEGVVGLMDSLGYATKGFSSAEAFLDSPEFHRAACLILDVCMPGMGGLELQRHLEASRDRIPIICITARRDQAVSAEAFRRGAVAVLSKPFSRDSLVDAVRSALAQRVAPTGRERSD